MKKIKKLKKKQIIIRHFNIFTKSSKDGEQANIVIFGRLGFVDFIGPFDQGRNNRFLYLS